MSRPQARISQAADGQAADGQNVLSLGPRVSSTFNRFGYRDFSEQPEHLRLVRWLHARAWLTNERPSILFDLATARLVERKVLLPGVTTLERLVASIRDRATERLWQRLAAAPNDDQRTRLDQLLVVPAAERVSPLEPVAVLDRDWVAEARREPDAQRQLRLIVGGACQVAARTAPFKEVMRDAAAAELAVRDLVRDDHQRRRLTQRGLVEILAERRQLRPGMSLRRAADTFFGLVNSATYDLVTTYCWWTVDQWQDWLVELIERELFG
jgi:hypothetical protein